MLGHPSKERHFVPFLSVLISLSKFYYQSNNLFPFYFIEITLANTANGNNIWKCLFRKLIFVVLMSVVFLLELTTKFVYIGQGLQIITEVTHNYADS